MPLHKVDNVYFVDGSHLGGATIRVMNDEFTMVDANRIISDAGFSVQLLPPTWIAYRDSRGECRIGAELFLIAGKPEGLELPVNSPLNTYPDGTDEKDKDRIVENIIRAGARLGYKVEGAPV